MTAPAATFELPETMKIDACQTLHAFLLGVQDQPVRIDCGAVRRLSGLAAQLIAMGAKTWAQKGHAFEILNPSEGFQESLETLGLTHLLATKAEIE